MEVENRQEEPPDAPAPTPVRRARDSAPAPTSRRSLAGLALLGTAASVAVVVGGALAGAASPGPSGRLWSVPSIPVRPTIGLIPSLFLFYGGLIGLVRSWLLLRRHLLTHGLMLVPLAAIVGAWALPLMAGPPLGSRDVYAYAAQGRLAEQGYDVYEAGPALLGDDDPVLAPVDPLYRETPVVYGPLFVWASEAIARATGDGVVAAVLMYRLVAVLGLLIAAVGVYDLARNMGRDPVDALVLAFANPLVLLHLVSGAHNEAMMLAFFVTGVAVARRARLVPVGIALCAMAAAIKLPAILGVAFVGWPWALEGRGRLARLGRAALVVVEAFVVIALAGRLTGWGWGWVNALTSTDPVEAYLSVTQVIGGGLALLFGFELAGVLALARLVGMVAAGGITAVLLLRRAASWPLALSWSLVIWALLHPTTQPWYLTWGIMLLAAASAGERNRTFVTGCALAAFVVLPVGPQLGLLVLEDTGLGTALLAVVLLVVLTFSPRTDHRSHYRATLQPGKVTVIAPTRHEAPNIEPFVAALEAAVVDRPVEVLFVDDSDDDTPAEIGRVAATAGIPVRLLHRSSADRWGGLGGAVVDGFHQAEGATVVVMDADLQHPASSVPDLLHTIDRGRDVAVASRRVPGGQDLGLTRARWLLSVVASSAARGLFPGRVGPVSDPLSGFFALRLGEIDLERLHPDGFKILVEVLATHPDLWVEERPFTFQGRRQGLSKASAGQGARYLGHLVDARLRTSWAWAGAAVPQRVFRSA